MHILCNNFVKRMSGHIWNHDIISYRLGYAQLVREQKVPKIFPSSGDLKVRQFVTDWYFMLIQNIMNL